MWCPSVSLTVWANAWLAGTAAPDDVLDALSQWVPRHSVSAFDPVAAGHAGLVWPQNNDAGIMALLQTLRTAAGPRPGPEPPLRIALPVAGDVAGLPAGTQFQTDALSAGEAVIVTGDRGSAIGMVPQFIEDRAHGEMLEWTVYSLPGAPPPEQHDLGEAEYALRSAVRTAADALGAMGTGHRGADVNDPRGQIQQVLEATRQHRPPRDAPPRALRVLENAAHVDAIVTVSSGLTTGDALQPLTALVRSARIAAVGDILHSAWRT